MEQAGWEQQEENEHRRYEEEEAERRAWQKKWRDTWAMWAKQEPTKEHSNAENR